MEDKEKEIIQNEETEVEELETEAKEPETKKKFKLVPFIIVLGISGAATIVLWLLSVQGFVGLIRRLVMPITAGVFACVLVCGICSLIGKKINSPVITSVISQIFVFAVVVGMGYFLLDPVRDIIHGATTEELYRIDYLTDEETGTISLDKNGNIINGKYQLKITIYATDDESEKNYTFSVDKSLYEEFKNGEYAAIIFSVSYYENSNILKSFDDETEELISSLLEGQGIEE